MSHHGQESTEMSPELRKALGLGPTGNFPEGNLNEADKGEIKVAIGINQGKVIIDFGNPTSWIGFTPEQAEEIARTIELKAKQVKIEGMEK